MAKPRALYWIGAAIALALGAGCGGGRHEPTGVENLATLKGQTIGVVALDSIASLDLRYVLQKGASVNSKALGGDVRYVEAPGDSLPDMLKRGDVAVAVLPPQVAFSLQSDKSYRVRTHLAAAMQDITGSPVMATALLTYRDETTAHPDALAEARRMLRESTSYFQANRDDVLDSIVGAQSLNNDYVRWQSERQRIVLGDNSRAVQQALLDLWQAAVDIGDITDSPTLDDVLFRETGASHNSGGRQTISIAVLDDASHRGALYAIEQGMVKSNLVDLDITYLSTSALGQAIAAREYDIVEGSPMLVATDRGSRLDLVVLSGGVEDLDSTLLFDYSRGE